MLPLTQAAWGMSAREAGMVQAALHLGYLTSLFVVGFIADHFGAKRAYVVTGVAACASPWAFVLFADGFWPALWLHAFTGLCQGGTYTPSRSASPRSPTSPTSAAASPAAPWPTAGGGCRRSCCGRA
ncbi:MAG: MFS transporter [Betaproteobacteria bacterium]